MTVSVDIRDNFKELERQLNSFRRKQLPFATANAINKTLFDARKFVVTSLWPRSVDVKKRGFARYAYRVDKASKIKLSGRLFDRSGRDILERQAKAGPQLPYSSSHLAIPTRHAKTATGRIKKRANLRVQQGNKNIFKATIKGTLGIWERSNRGQLKLLYLLEPRVYTPRSYPFYPKVEKLVRRVFPGHFDTAFKRGY